MYKNKECNL